MKTRQESDAALQELRRQLWRSVHRGPPPPIQHPIPRLSPPPRGRWRLAEIEAFIRARSSGAALVSVAVAALLCAGCTVVRYDGPGGERFSRSAIGTASALTALEVETGTNGVRRISLRGYHSDSANALGTVTEAAVRAAMGK